MFHFGGFPSCTYVFSTGSMVLHHGGFPIRTSPDQLICSSPRLIAACHVLHRLLMPRHSPYALFRLNFLCCSFSIWIVWVSLEHGFYLLFVKRQFAFFECFPPCNYLLRWNCSYYPNIGKTLNFDWSRYLMSSISVRFNSFLFSYSIFNDHNCLLLKKAGRSGWTRTIDLALIRRAL